jgi:hypothetical protein
LNIRPSTTDELRDVLRQLAQLRPADRGEYQHVQRACLLLTIHIKNSGPLGVFMPEIAWHFLTDADIRDKDPEYADVQGRALLSALDAWEEEEKGWSK